jgi:Zn-dependent peptidase ImmA (M78 family)
MRRPRRSSAEQAADKLLEKLNISEVPVPIDRVIKAMDASVVYERMGSEVSGMTYRHGERVIIGLNSAHSSRRQRFTAAHEIGHITLHPGRPLTIDSSIRVNFRDKVSSQATDVEEIEANAFAAALLMPADAVVEVVQSLTGSGIRSRDRLVGELARRFEVSPEAMGYRLINLGVASAP